MYNFSILLANVRSKFLDFSVVILYSASSASSVQGARCESRIKSMSCDELRVDRGDSIFNVFDL